MPPERLTLRLGDREIVVEVIDAEQVAVNGERVRARPEGVGVVRVEGATGGLAWAVRDGDVRWVYHDGCVYVLEVQRAGGRRRPTHEAGSLAAPMPATVRQVRVGIGDAVVRGDTLIVLEAMKMELPVRANADGRVTAIHCSQGDLVQPGRPLVEIDEQGHG